MHQAAEPAKRAAVKLLAKAASGLMAVLTALSPLGFFLLLLLVILVLLMSILGYRNIGMASNVNLNPLVASYRELVTEVSERYEMEEYVDLLLAVMMVDSCGEGQDPMMMSEREYNLEYPRTPGSITEPEYSIDCGVRALQEMLGSVGVVGSTDLVGIRIALQGYNFGRDYIRWMQENRYYEWTYDTACAYAQSTGATQRGDTPHPDGPWNYGNQHYPERVLYYYSLASAAMPEDGLPIPVFHQYDFVQPYGGGTISTSGCGPTCIAMVASYLKNSTITPTDIVNWCGNRYYVEGEGSSWAIFGAAAQHFGLGEVKATYSAAEVRAALEAGRPVISSQAPGLFTQNGHFIVLRGINPEGKILVNDPNDNNMKGYQTRGFDLEREIHRTSKCYWIFEAKTAAAPQQ